MFLKSLTIENDSKLIREIQFHRGLNLIVDETDTVDKRKSGNNVGKTTVLRLVRFCFGGDGKNIYKDTEFKEKSNSQIENFLKNNNIIITLTLKGDLDISNSREIIIRRNFLSRRDKILEVNGKMQTVKEFPILLKELIFKNKQLKPTLKQIVAKNIRDEKNRLSNTLNVLNPYTRVEEYEALFLFWLGVDVGENARKQRLMREQSTENNLLKRLGRETSISQIDQSLIVVDRAIAELEEKKLGFNVNDNYESDLNNLNETKSKINARSTCISSLELRRDLIIVSQVELVNDESHVDAKRVESLYNEAKILIPSLQRTFEETLAFHNAMIKEKEDYITSELPSLEKNMVKVKKEIADLLVAEKSLSEKLRKAGAIDELQEIVGKLNDAHEKKGTLEEQKRLWMETGKKLEEIQEELDGVCSGIDTQGELIEKRITQFNEHFSSISSRLYGEHFVLSSDKGPKGYQLKISSLSGNLGTGKKKGQIAAFDLAYIKFADAQGIECLHFILQDQIENVHDNQISSLLMDIVAEINCQYILPVLRDKLPGEIPISQYGVLSLSQEDKLFKM